MSGGVRTWSVPAPRKKAPHTIAESEPTVTLPGFLALPYVVKKLVVQWTYWIERYDRDSSKRGLPLSKVMRVNKEFNELAQSFFWKIVSFENRQPSDLKWFLKHIIPRYARFIQLASFPSEVRPDHMASGSMMIIGLWQDPSGPRRRELYQHIIPLLPNLREVSVEFTFPSTRPTSRHNHFSRSVVDPEPEVPLTLMPIGSQLRRMTVIGDENHGPLDAKFLASFLVKCPNLVSLQLTNVDKCDGDDLLLALRGLRDLTSLGLDEVLDYDRRYGTTHGWTAPIHGLLLDNNGSSDPETISLFTSHFRHTLKMFRTHDNRDLLAPSTPFALSNLTVLAVWSSGKTVDYLRAFATSPLKELDMQGPQKSSVYKDVQPLKDALLMFKETLSSVRLWIDIPREEMVAFGKEHGFVVEVESDPVEGGRSRSKR